MAPPTVVVRNLGKSYVTTRPDPKRGLAFWRREEQVREAVKGVSFTLEAGEMVGFIGPNGAGKTTTLKMLSGILYPTSGEATVLGFVPWERSREYRKQFSIIMGQRNQLWWELPPLETFKLHQVMYAIPQDIFDLRLQELVTLLEVSSVIERPTQSLSLGERMKCEIIASLLHQPKVLFLDEPTIGLDIVSQQKIRDFLREYNTKYRVTVLLTSHYMQDVESLCQRTILIDNGLIAYDGSIDLLKQEYAEEKEIKLTFNTPVQEEQLRHYGVVVMQSSHVAMLRCHQKQVKEVVARLLSELPVVDIAISEESLESVIASIFSRPSKS